MHLECLQQAAGQTGPHRLANSRFATTSSASILTDGAHGPRHAMYTNTPDMTIDMKSRCDVATCVVRSGVARTCSNQDGQQEPPDIFCPVLYDSMSRLRSTTQTLLNHQPALSKRHPVGHGRRKSSSHLSAQGQASPHETDFSCKDAQTSAHSRTRGCPQLANSDASGFVEMLSGLVEML